MFRPDTDTVNKWIPVFWGALWGLYEASIGFLVHTLVPIPGLSGFLLFPFAFFCMQRVWKDYGKWEGVAFAAVVAASVKLADFALLAFVPVSPVSIIHPAMAILLEAFAFITIAVFLPGRAQSRETEPRNKYVLSPARTGLRVFALSLGWRLLFIPVAIGSAAIFAGGMFGRGLYLPWRFLLLDSMLNALLIVGVWQLYHLWETGAGRRSRVSRPGRTMLFRPAGALSLFMLALLVETGGRLL